MELEDSFDEQNKKLFDSLQQAGIKIDFEIDPDSPSWYVQEIFHYKIGSPDNNQNPAAMAHELLHIKLYTKGFENVLGIYKYYNPQNSFFTIERIGQLNNTLAHYKMIDDFLAMGYHIDDFLQDTPKQYFLDGILLGITGLMLQHNAGIANLCEQTENIIMVCGSLLLFEQYKIKHLETQNGLHPGPMLDQLKEINKELVEGIEAIFREWQQADTVDNLSFYQRLDALLKRHAIPNAADCAA